MSQEDSGADLATTNQDVLSELRSLREFERQDNNPWRAGVANDAIAEIERLRKRATHIESENPWIKCSERLPGLGEQVLVRAGDHVFISEWMEIREAPVSFSTQTIHVGYGFADDDLFEVTHWMPLPKLPEAPYAD